jgi:hypothetical protein
MEKRILTRKVFTAVKCGNQKLSWQQLSRSHGCYLTKSFHTAILKLSERRFYFIFIFA